MATKFKYDYDWWVPHVFGTLEGKDFFAILYKDGHWACDNQDIGMWLETTGKVWAVGTMYNRRAAAMLAAQRKFAGKLTMITEEEFKQPRPKPPKPAAS